jgi:hypothetical protein
MNVRDIEIFGDQKWERVGDELEIYLYMKINKHVERNRKDGKTSAGEKATVVTETKYTEATHRARQVPYSQSLPARK